MTKILLIHGINNEGNSIEKIQAEWPAALQKGAAKLGLNLPNDVSYHATFYGNLLAEETDSWGDKESSVEVMGGGSSEDDFVNDTVGELYQELQILAGLTDDDVALFLSEEDDKAHATPMAKGIHKRWLKAIARALEAVLPSKGKWVIRLFLKQASAYLSKPGLKVKIDSLVYDEVFKSITPEDDVVVVSHSLGTVVAYDLLRKYRHQVRPKLYLTLGSPLGVEVIKKGLGPPLVCLPNVDKWVNVSDPEDMVALKRRLNAETFGCDDVDNHSDVDNEDENAHSIEKYLAQEPVVRAILATL